MRSSLFHIILLFFTLASAATFGQFGAEFSLVSNKGCAPFTVSVIDSSGAPPGNVNVYNYGELATVTQDTFYTYTTPGVYMIIQTVPSGNPRFDTVFVEVVPPSSPIYNLSNCKGTEAFFHGDDSLYQAFWVDWGDGNSDIVLNKQIQQHDYGVLGTYNVSVQGMMDPTLTDIDLANISCATSNTNLTLILDIIPGTIDRIEDLNADSILLNFSLNAQTSYFLEMSLNGSTSFTTIDTFSVNSIPPNYIINNLNTDGNFYCFRLTAFDPCDGSTIPSPVSCSVQLQASASNNENQLNWTTETFDLNNFEINRNGGLINSTTSVQYIDTDVSCGSNYCYQVILNENGGLESLSNTVCVTAISLDVPPPILNINTTIENGLPQLSWNIPGTTPGLYLINRTDEDGANPVSFTATNNIFTDSSASPATTSYLYEVSYEDLCGNSSLSVEARPVFLSMYLNPTIRWTNYLGWQNGYNAYLVEIYDEEGSFIQTLDVGLDTSYTESDFLNIPQTLIYRIVALPSTSGILPVFSNYLTVTFPSNVVFPNAFTPDGDGLNDVFTYTGLFISEFRMLIYNKWGEIIFETDNPDLGWDGTKDSFPAPSGMYIFSAEFTDEAGISFVKKGEVYLLR